MWSSTKSYFAVSRNLWKSSSSASHRILKTKTSLWSITRCVFLEVAQNTGNNIRYTRKRKDGTTARTKIWIALERFLCNKLRHLGCDWRTLVKMNGDSVILFVTTPTRHKGSLSFVCPPHFRSLGLWPVRMLSRAQTFFSFFFFTL